LAAALTFSFVGAWIEPFAHKVGVIVLRVEPLQATYASLFNLPLGPWLGFNNTAVAGSLVMGAYLAYPAYWTAGQLFSAARRLRKGAAA
jgi:uncharacterized protein (TIGR03546 family)